MFDKLKQRWRVNGINLLLIILTFALGGSLCGFAGRKLLLLTGLEKGPVWIILYIVIVTLLWPLCVLLISIPFGQFYFFKTYLQKIFLRIGGKKENTIAIAIFASGAGSNAEKIIGQFHLNKNKDAVKSSGELIEAGHKMINGKVALIVCNKPGAGVLKIAENYKIKALLIEKDQFFNGDHYLPHLKENKIDLIVLAGFLWKVPAAIIQAYPGKIVNIHPALLPKYGGKGMYGMKVHEAVIAAGEKESGITIHFVDELYDHGKVILQETCDIDPTDTPESLAHKVHLLEHLHYPRVVQSLINAK